jgi:NADH-quinone oxidoreductase subunit I
MAYLISKPKRTLADQSYAVEAIKGLSLTIRRFFTNTIGPADKNKIATIRYPDEVREYPERFRGVHRLTHRADGSPRCVACLCCSTACPAQCIYIEPAEYEQDDPRYGYERYPRAFVIDELRCIFCGYCVEACPCDAIRMDTGMHVPASWSRDHFIFDKETLMSIPGRDGTYVTANPRHEPGDPTHPGVDRAKAH